MTDSRKPASTPAEFIAKWAPSILRERQASQEHFIGLCRLLGQPTPADDDPKGERYCFERGAAITGGGDGWADVWRRGRRPLIGREAAPSSPAGGRS